MTWHTPDCDGNGLYDERHLWSENTLFVFDHRIEDSEGDEAVGQMNGHVKHCEKCGAALLPLDEEGRG